MLSSLPLQDKRKGCVWAALQEKTPRLRSYPRRGQDRLTSEVFVGVYWPYLQIVSWSASLNYMYTRDSGGDHRLAPIGLPTIAPVLRLSAC